MIFYTNWERNKPDNLDLATYEKDRQKMSKEELQAFNSNKNFYEIKFENIGGNPMPIILELKYEDGSSELKTIPAEVWRYNDKEITKVFYYRKSGITICFRPLCRNCRYRQTK